MAKNQKFLLAADGSAESLSIVNYAAQTLPPERSDLVLYHVFNRIPETYWDFGLGPETDMWMKKIKDQERQHEDAIKGFMTDAKEKLMDAGFREQNLTVEIHNRSVGIARDIAAEAQRGYDALMMGRTGLGQMKGLAMGSVATKILGLLTQIPVCIVAGQPSAKNIIVAMDGSEGAMRALKYAADIADDRDSEVVLFHAMRQIGYHEPPGGKVSALAEIQEAIWEDARKLIEPTMEEGRRILTEAGLAESKVKAKVVTGVKSRAGALVAEAKNSSCGTIVVGRTGISQVEDFNIGRVASKVVYSAENTAVWIIP